MIFSYLKKYLGIFVLAVAIIAVYKTFDNFGAVLGWLGTLSKLLTPFFISFAIAYLLYPLCLRIETVFHNSKAAFLRKNRRGLAIACTYTAVLIVLALSVSFIVPIAMKSIADLIAYLPTLIPKIADFARDFDFYGINTETLISNISIDKILAQLDLTNINKYAEGVMGISNMLLNIVMGFIISVYILLDRHNLKNGVIRIARLYIKPSTELLVRKYLRSINNFVYKYIVCQFAYAIIVFVLALISLSLLKVKYAVALAAMLGIFNLIPYFGAIIAGVIAVIITAFTMSLGKAAAVAIAIVILQQVDSNVINPALVKDQLAVKPFWVILGILIGGGFFGVLGVFFAAPVMALFKIMLNDYLTIKENGGFSDDKNKM